MPVAMIERILVLNAAWEVLGDSERRRALRQQLHGTAGG
jgi:hypothetical protein